MTDLDQVWDELASETPTGQEGRSVRRLQGVGPCGVRLYQHMPRRCRGFEIELRPNQVPPRLRFDDTAGYCVDVRTEAGQSARTTVSVTAASPEFNGIFGRLVSDVIAELARHGTQREAISGAAARLEVWVRFFRRAGAGGLSAEEQRGLFAELLVFEEFVLTGMPVREAVEAWIGPIRRPHDFVCPRVSLEVKSTIGASAGTVRISGARQLDETVDGRRLLLLVHFLEPVPTGGESLAGLIQRVTGAVRAGDPSAAVAFADRLRVLGIESGALEPYTDPRYVSRCLHVFEVTSGFPRLRESDVPSGVDDLRYRVQLGACENFRRPSEYVREMVRN